eukprot:Nitzschia sp. Nitz4//scaffold209_size42451//33849//36188//NITZ4_007363-RA/size42451-snap-gene-0.49-mRNA-1//-1//CDS//3329541715//5287//frame0
MDSGIPSLLMQAAQSAAQADGVLANGGGDMSDVMQQQMLMMQKKSMNSGPANNKKKGPALRRGKWTPEEEAYANRLIQEFKAGLLPLTDGTTLRTFLSKLLNCDPMRISKKFVGSNCIGKQVFRRRTADLNRLTPEQIQKSRSELSELERRFLERVAQTNRVKSSGGGGAMPGVGGPLTMESLKKEGNNDNMNAGGNIGSNPSLGLDRGMGGPHTAAPWMHGSLGGGGLNGGVIPNSRTAAVGRALLQGFSNNRNKSGSGSGLSSHNSAELLAMAELQRRASHQSLLQSMGGNSAQNFLASQGMSQMAQNSARMAELNSGNSLSNLMKGLSRDQLSQLARERGISSASLSNMIERKNSFDALMGIDFQSLQSIDNLANLIGGNPNNIPSSGMKNWSAEPQRTGSNESLSNAARRLASAGNMESLLRSLSGGSVRNGRLGGAEEGSTANANLQNLLQNMQQSNSMSSLFGGGNASLANLLRENSAGNMSSALRMQGNASQRNASVDDLLSAVTSGGDGSEDGGNPFLNGTFMSSQNRSNGMNGFGMDRTTMMAQQQLLAQATGNPSLANALSSRSMGMGGFNSQGDSSDSAAALLARANGGEKGALKRKLVEMGNGSEQGASKR